MERDQIIRGLAENPAVPVRVLIDLSRQWPGEVALGLAGRAGLPPDLQEALAGHESWRVRAALARHPRLDPVVRERLAGDPDGRVRIAVARARHQPPLSEETLLRLMADLLDPPDPRITPHELFEQMVWADWQRVFLAARHPEPVVRRFAAGSAWRPELRHLLTDPDPRVVELAAAAIAEHERVMQPADLPDRHCHATWTVLQRPLSVALAEQVAASEDLVIVRFFTGNETIPPHLVDRLSRHSDTEVRAGIAVRADLTAGQVEALAADPEAAVRVMVATRPGLTAAQVTALAADPDETVRTKVAQHAYLSERERSILAHTTDLGPGLVPSWARSDNPRLRRRAAGHPALPHEMITILAEDPDPAVRADLALHQPDTPGDLLLSCYLDGRHRHRLLELPQFPRTGLARFAAHPDPEVRRLTARDPEAGPAVIDGLTHDPDRLVREAMARCPALPAGRLTELLDDPELARDAAANPALDWRSVVAAL
ncbi:MAG TPA: hypothetical protein VN408_31525 [Actinoplanes sp.]|nr:hypothetical protein [Actinoplanes sp.]